MKKFIFSAVAMIAFVGSSMASNEVVKDCLSTNFVLEINDEMDCNAIQAETIQLAKSRGMTDDYASKAGYKMYFWCKSENVGKMTLGLQQ